MMYKHVYVFYCASINVVEIFKASYDVSDPTNSIVEFKKTRYFWLLAGQRLATLVSGGSHSVASPRTPYLWS